MDGKFLEGQKLGAHRIVLQEGIENEAEVRTNRFRHRDRFDKSGRETAETGAGLGGAINWRKASVKTSTESPNTGSSLRGEVGSIPTLAVSKAIKL
jgi:hypothetical protein